MQAGRMKHTGTISILLTHSHFGLISPPICPLHLSFSTCLWSSASFTFQSSTCSSSSWQGIEQREREQGRGSCPLWVVKRLTFERSNPLHHTSRNLLSSHITLWEPVSAFTACLAPPLLFFFISPHPFIFTSFMTRLARSNPTYKTPFNAR